MPPRMFTKPLPLCSADLENLRASGLLDNTIRANRLETKDGALVFPYRSLNGGYDGYDRRRPHKPRRGKKGKPIKYEQKPGTPNRAYFPYGFAPLLKNKANPIFIVEGEKKALALQQTGRATIGLGGVYNWKNAGEEQLIGDLRQIDWSDRCVYIAFDYDVKPSTRSYVSNASKRLAKLLGSLGALVRIADLPPGPEGGKQGVDDFLLANDEEAFEAVLTASKTFGDDEPAAVKRGSNDSVTGGDSIIKIIPPTLGEDAYHGMIGEFLNTVAPHTEATDPAVLAHFLPAIGTLCGTTPYVFAGSKQPPRISSVVVGPTNRGRKGSSFAPVNYCMMAVDDEFWEAQYVTGLSSGEGLIARVTDRKYRNEDGEEEIEVAEKRVFVVEQEFSQVLAVASRQGSITSQVIRQAYDDGKLSTLTVNPREAYGAHISIVGHITPAELEERLGGIEMANGFGNRFLWFYSESDKILPHPRPFPSELFSPFKNRLQELLELGAIRSSLAIHMNPLAAEFWKAIYTTDLRDDRPGRSGAMVARGSSMVLRLALIYCLVDKWRAPLDKPSITLEHLKAALAVWEYSKQSAILLFGQRSGASLSDKILRLLEDKPMTKTELNRHLSPNQKAASATTLQQLESAQLVRKVLVKPKGAGRPAEKWERLTREPLPSLVE